MMKNNVPNMIDAYQLFHVVQSNGVSSSFLNFEVMHPINGGLLRIKTMSGLKVSHAGHLFCPGTCTAGFYQLSSCSYILL